MTASPKIRCRPTPRSSWCATSRCSIELARLNLATFATTWMEPQARELVAECVDKNMIDKDEYPQTAELERRCVNILADLWHAPDPNAIMGCSTTGSSEACMLAGMALKRRWSKLGRTGEPNLVMGANVQICWEKFCEYWVHFRRRLRARRRHRGRARRAPGTVRLDIPVHVDGASGAMIAPFLEPELVWDVRLPRVASINTSGHKYGLVYPGVGWVVWRDKAALPEELVFNVNYLGGDMPTFALNFSRPVAEVAAQYYTFVRLGREGFRAVQPLRVTWRLSWRPGSPNWGPSNCSPAAISCPCSPSRRKRTSRASTCHGGFVSVAGLSRRTRSRRTGVLRIVVRNGFTHDLADLLLADLRRLLPELDHGPRRRTAFHH